jgi:hypothetical protein
VDAETKESTRKTEEICMEGIRKAMNERNLNEGQREDRKQWSLGVGQRRKNVLKNIYKYSLLVNCKFLCERIQGYKCRLLNCDVISQNFKGKF